MIERLVKLQANKRQFTNTSELSESLTTNIVLRAEIDQLSKTFLNKTVSGCNNCYLDAYMELIYLNIDKAMKKIECEFKLLSGAVLKDTNGDRDLMCSNANLTNELALYHLKSNPNCKDQFQKIPKNLDEQLENYQLPELASKAIAAREEANKKKLDKLNDIIESRNLEITNLKSEIETRGNRIADLEGQIEEKDNEITQLSSHSNERQYNGDIDSNALDITDKQKQAEETLVLEIAERIKKGETRTSIKESLKDGKVGEMNLTQRFISELITRADELSK